MSSRRAVGFVLGLLLAACGGGTSADSDAQCASLDGGAGAGSITFLSPCDPCDPAACSTGLCFSFNSKGPLCSKACTADSDCEAPSPGCNNMGVCKAP